MKAWLMAAFVATGVVMAWPLTAGAEKMYVTDTLWVNLRSEPRFGSNTAKAIQSGQVVEIVSTAEIWAQVRLPDGTTGWLMQKYLTAEMTAGRRLKTIQDQHAALENQVRTYRRKSDQLEEENQKLREELTLKIRHSDDLVSAYETLKTEAADFIELKEKFEKTNLQLKEQKARAEQLANELSKIESQRIIRWFLTGAGVLLLGFIIGLSARRQRRRSIFT